MTDRVEGCREIEANEQCDFLAVSRSVDAVKDIEQRRLVIKLVFWNSLPVALRGRAKTLNCAVNDKIRCL